MAVMADSGTYGCYSAEPGLCPRSRSERSEEWWNNGRCDLRKPSFGQSCSFRGSGCWDYERDKCWEFRTWEYFVSQQYDIREYSSHWDCC
jgi:hypothetical protein